MKPLSPSATQKPIGESRNLPDALSSARLSYCVFTEGKAGVVRFPGSGWLEGSLENLADMVRLVSVPQRAVEEAATTLQEGIDGAAKLLDEMNETRPGITAAIARLLGMSNVSQTRRMACAIIANALVFQERIAGMHEGVRPLALVCGDGVDDPQAQVLAAWDDILKINYWAIFAIAKDILQQLDAGGCGQGIATTERHGPSGQRHRRGQRPRPDGPHLPAAHCR